MAERQTANAGAFSRSICAIKAPTNGKRENRKVVHKGRPDKYKKTHAALRSLRPGARTRAPAGQTAHAKAFCERASADKGSDPRKTLNMPAAHKGQPMNTKDHVPFGHVEPPQRRRSGN